MLSHRKLDRYVFVQCTYKNEAFYFLHSDKLFNLNRIMDRQNLGANIYTALLEYIPGKEFFYFV
jgi:hypothetical protein